MKKPKVYPVAEKFVSLQGEGRWAGVSMGFIRLAGCSVGKKYGKCETVLGICFQCDTDYQTSILPSIEDLVDWSFDQAHICLTGGEPFDHDLEPLISALIKSTRATIHIETSGTTKPPHWLQFGTFPRKRIWVTVSPKKGCLIEEWKDLYNEVKLLVSTETSSEQVRGLADSFQIYDKEFFIQPIYDVRDDALNINHAISICHDLNSKNVRLSIQTHKYLGLR